MAARSSSNSNPTSQSEYHRSLRGEMQLHHGSSGATGRQDQQQQQQQQQQRGYPLGHSQQAAGGPYPMHFMGAPGAGAIDLRQQRESGVAGGAYLHPRSGDMVRAAAAAAAGNMGGGLPGGASGARSGRDGYADVAVARQCEREDCTVQPSYGKVWKKVRPQRSLIVLLMMLLAAAVCCCGLLLLLLLLLVVVLLLYAWY